MDREAPALLGILSDPWDPCFPYFQSLPWLPLQSRHLWLLLRPSDPSAHVFQLLQWSQRNRWVHVDPMDPCFLDTKVPCCQLALCCQSDPCFPCFPCFPLPQWSQRNP